MSVIRVGSSGTYASGWDAIFGGGKGKKAVAKKKVAAKKSSAPKAKKSAKKKSTRR